MNQTALSLGIPIGTLYAWVEKAKAAGITVVADNNGTINNINVKNLIDENRELKKTLISLRRGESDIKKSRGVFCQGIIARYAFIKNHRSEFFVMRMFVVLRASRNGFYAWLNRKSSKREQSNQLLDVKIKSIFAKHHQRYGAPRIMRELKKQNETCSENVLPEE